MALPGQRIPAMIEKSSLQNRRNTLCESNFSLRFVHLTVNFLVASVSTIRDLLENIEPKQQ